MSRGARLAALYPQETIGSALERHLSRYFANFGENLPPPGLYHHILREVE